MDVTVGAACRVQPMDLWYPLACLPRGCVSRSLLTVRSLLALQSVLVLFRQKDVLVWYLWSTLLRSFSAKLYTKDDVMSKLYLTYFKL